MHLPYIWYHQLTSAPEPRQPTPQVNRKSKRSPWLAAVVSTYISARVKKMAGISDPVGERYEDASFEVCALQFRCAA